MIQDYNEYKLSNKERLALVMVSVGFLLLAGTLYINSIITVVISPIAYGFASQRYMSYMIAKRRTRLRNEFKELLYSFSASFALLSSSILCSIKVLVAFAKSSSYCFLSNLVLIFIYALSISSRMLSISNPYLEGLEVISEA